MSDKDLEAELASLQPRGLSAQCVGRIDEALSDTARASWRIYPRRSLLVVAIAAAVLIAAAIVWSMLPGRHNPAAPRPTVAGQPAAAQPCASLGTYRRAFENGPGALDALLDRESASSSRTKRNDELLRAGFCSASRFMN